MQDTRVATLILALVPLVHEAPPTEWPLERIIANLEERLRVAPDDPRTLYTLGRAHAFAFVLEETSLWVLDNKYYDAASRGAEVYSLESQRRFAARDRAGAPRPGPAEMLDHLSEGVRCLRRACEIREVDAWLVERQPKRLTLAWLLETGAHLASRVDTLRLFDLHTIELSEQDVKDVERALGELLERPRETVLRNFRPSLLGKMARRCAERGVSSNKDEQAVLEAVLELYWLDQAIEHYRRCAEDSIAPLRTVRNMNVMDVVYEARDSMMRLLQERGLRDADEGEAVARLQQRIAEVEGFKRASRGVTPILLSLDGCRPLDDLLVPGLAVPFDLDGDAIDELWPWIAPSAGWLVWDPARRGEITSGLQLFGSASAWLFFADGYRVLDALDDDRDARVNGAELIGIAVWFDRDSDGVSDRGEVVPVEELGIVALATEATERIERSLGNPGGVELADGRVLPTYDWVLSPVSE